MPSTATDERRIDRRIAQGRALKRIRMSVVPNMTQKDLAMLLGRHGYETTGVRVSHWEVGRNGIPPEVFDILADIFGRDRQEFLILMMRADEVEARTPRNPRPRK
jgi:hypothetical protein